MKSLIPLRPSEVNGLSENEQLCLAWQVISGCKPTDAFKAFVKPELSVSPVTLDKVAKQFFGSQPAIKFIAEYKELIGNILNPVKRSSDREKTPEERKKEKEKALQSLTDYVVDRALNFENIEDKDDILKYADKLGLLGDDEEKVEAPRRYLPEMCSTCEYKKWIEANCEITE